MAAPLIVQKISAATRDAWPEVQHAMDQTTRTMIELAELSEDVHHEVETWAARGGNTVRKRRKICEETIWVLARLGWLRTGGERQVVQLAQRLAELDYDEQEQAFLAVEDELLAAAQAIPTYTEEKSE